MSRHYGRIAVDRFLHRHSRLLTTAAATVFVASLAHTAFAQDQPAFTDLARHSEEAQGINKMVAEGVMSATAPGTFSPDLPMKRGDFAVAVQRLFSLPQPDRPTKFTDVRAADSVYAAVEALTPYMDKQVPCPGCELGAKFFPDKPLARAQSAVTLVRILVAQKKLQLLSEAQTDKALTSVPDAQDLPKHVRPYFATAIQAGIMECCVGNTIAPTQGLTRADTADILDKVQRRFDIPPVKGSA